MKPRKYIFLNIKKKTYLSEFHQRSKITSQGMKNHKICKGGVLAKVLQLSRKEDRALESLRMIINGFKSKYGYSVLDDGEVTAIRDEERAEMLLQTFMRIPNYENISKEGKREEKVQ